MLKRLFLGLMATFVLAGCSSMLIGGSPVTPPPVDCDPERDRNCRSAISQEQVESEA